MVDHKPLPPIPANLTVLSLDARSHRAQLVRLILSEIQEPGIENRRDGWAVVLEEVLDEFGQCLNKGDWLKGIRETRELRTYSRNCQAKRDKEIKLKDVAKAKKQVDSQEKVLRIHPHDESSKGEVTKGLSASDEIRLGKDKELPSRPSSTMNKPSGKHLLLCVAPLESRVPVPVEDSGFDLIPANIGCTFVPGSFSLMEAEETTVLYGSSEIFPSANNAVKVVGGTFTFKGVNSTIQHKLLFNVLRISIYIHLSLVLEQHILLDSNVHLIFQRPKIPSSSPSAPDRPSMERTITTESKSKKPTSFLPPGILSFFSKNNMSHRSSTIMPILGRGSLDLGISTSRQSKQEEKPLRLSIDTSVNRLRRFSLIGDRRPSVKNSAGSVEDAKIRFSVILKQIQDSGGLLSTSPGVFFEPPTLIVDLAEKERHTPTRRLKGDERAGLSSLLGWDGKETQGKGMSGTLGFIRQQELSVLFSHHVPCASSGLETPSSTNSSSSSHKTKPFLYTTCGRPSWKTYTYYSSDPNGDTSLGEAIAEFISNFEEACGQPGCHYKLGQHETRLIHGGVLITINTEETKDVDGPPEVGFINVWENCVVCGAKTKWNRMTDGTYLLSFGKFLELLVYSPPLYSLNPTLCEHTSPPPRPWPTHPISRLNTVRNFSTESYTVSFTLTLIEYIFELRVPRLQITRGAGERCSKESIVPEKQVVEGDGKKELRREIKRWWEGVTDHLDKLETVLASDESPTPNKALPRLPSADDAYDGDDSNIDEAEPPKTPPHDPMASLPLLPSTPHLNLISGADLPATPSPVPPAPASTPVRDSTGPPAHRLLSLRHTFQRIEQALYSELSRTPVSSLNDVRRSFYHAAKGAQKRLLAWQKKHVQLSADTQAHLELSVDEPEWWGQKCHAVPGGNIIVREDDWGSIIAFTLSTSEYQHELSNLSINRSASQQLASQPSLASPSQSSFFSSAVGYRLFTPSTHTQLDPDQEGVVWSEPESFSSVISRKEHPRDPAILSIREVLRQKSPVDGTALTASRFGSLGSVTPRSVAAPPSAWAKPDVQISMDAADGDFTPMPDTIESAGKILQEIESVTNESSRSSSRASGASMSDSVIDSYIRRGKASSVISVESEATVGRKHGSSIKLSSLPPPLPPKDESKKQGDVLETQHGTHTGSTVSSFTGTLASGLNSAMRYVLNSGDTARGSSTSPKSHHGLLLADASSIDERPHIKYDWTLGKRLKFSCTVYYAKQFDTLRRRCGIDDVFIKSLSRSANWAADGGKSRSNFWKTSDDRFIIKTLVDAWNVADLQVLIELAPSYFRYIDATASKATVLAKMLGFYTIEIRNLETGAVQSRSDLLVMENLFYDQKVAKTFDLKGIQGRKVKTGVKSAQNSSTKTMFDGEWIEGQQKTLMLVRPHSKQVLRAAIKSDAEYLSRSNIMDYSLLVGVDDENKQIACGLVDTIGSYTFAKTLEYKAKHGLNSGKDITVMPPAEYQERFVSALDGYFLACPDKWSKPLDESKIINDPSDLPSVL